MPISNAFKPAATLAVGILCIFYIAAFTTSHLSSFAPAPKRDSAASAAYENLATTRHNRTRETRAEIPLIYYGDGPDVPDTATARRTCAATVPKRVHQTWKTDLVPGNFVDYVKSWVAVHPDWEYWFWTDALADRFIARRFPAYIDMYRNYAEPIMRADAMRYFILLEFGGVYADLDMMALRPLDELAGRHPGLIPQDHAVHRYVFWRRERIPLNALMMFVPGHPFIRLVVERLPAKDAHTPRHLWLEKTGPMMLDALLTEYAELNGATVADLCRTVYVAPDERFVPLFNEPYAVQALRQKCRQNMRPPDPRVKWCDYLRRTDFKNSPVPASAYTKHMFVNTYAAWKKLKPTPISDIVHDRVDIEKRIAQL